MSYYEFEDEEHTEEDIVNQDIFESSIELVGLTPGIDAELETCSRCGSKLREDGTVKYCGYDNCEHLVDSHDGFDNYEPLRFDE